MKNATVRIALILACALWAMAPMCADPVPIKEMATAKMEITRALSVRAEKYAPEEYKAAQDGLFECHRLLGQDKLDRARESASLASKKAGEAFEKSLPLLARDTIEVAEKSLLDAGEANAPVLAKDEYELAQEELKKASERFESKKFHDAHLAALEADRLAKNARNAALGRKGILKEAIDEVNATLAEAGRYEVAKYAPEKAKAAEENNRIAAEGLESLQLKKGFAAVEIAKVNADEAYLESIKGYARDGLIEAEALVEKAKKSEGAAGAGEELEAAREALAGAKAAYADAKYRECITSVSEAKRLCALVLGAKGADIAVSGAAKKDPRKAARRRDGVFTTEGEAGDSSMYRVRYNPGRRDCLWRIAAKHFKNPRLWKRIYEANRDRIRNPHLIYPGMMLRLPSLEKPRHGGEKPETEAIPPPRRDEDAGNKPVKDASGR